MGKGRKQKPNNLKLVQGTQRKDRENSEAPTPVDASPRAPGGVDAEVAEWFGRLVGRLEQEGRASTSHTEIIWLTADALAEMEKCRQTAEDNGRYYEAENGLWKKHPAVNDYHEARRHAHSLLAELGLSPVTFGKTSKLDQGETGSRYKKFVNA